MPFPLPQVSEAPSGPSGCKHMSPQLMYPCNCSAHAQKIAHPLVKKQGRTRCLTHLQINHQAQANLRFLSSCTGISAKKWVRFLLIIHFERASLWEIPVKALKSFTNFSCSLRKFWAL